MDNSHVLTFRRASCSAYSSSMGTPCWLRCCRWVRSSRHASFGRKLLAHTWGGTSGHRDGLRVPSICRDAPDTLPICRSVLPPGGESNMWQPQGTVPWRGGDRTGMRGSFPQKALGLGQGGFPFTSSAWVCCCRVTHRDLWISQVTGGTASPGSGGAGWSSPSSLLCSRRSMEEEMQPAGPSSRVPTAGCFGVPGTPRKHPTGKRSLRPAWKVSGVCSGDRGPTSNQDGPNPGCCQSTQPWPPTTTQDLQGRERRAAPTSPRPAPRGRKHPARLPALPTHR